MSKVDMVLNGNIMGSVASTGGLFAPLDALRFTLAYVLIAGIPGYALATLARPQAPRSERLALAIPCAYSLVALDGLATAVLHLPFSLISYATVALPLALATAFLRQRSGADDPTGRRERWWLVPVGVALTQVAVIVTTYMRYVVPVGFDAVIHVEWSAMIVRTLVYPLSLQASHVGANDGAFYPAAFHALVALVLEVAPMATYRAVFFSVVIVAAFLPLSLFTYVRVATGRARLGGLAALAALAFEPLPLFALAQGLYPVMAVLLFMPALALALRRGLLQNDRRALALAALLGIGLLYTHPTEFAASGLLVLAIVPGGLRDRRSWMRAAGQSLLLVAVWVAALLPVRAALHSAAAYATHDALPGAEGSALSAHPQLPSIVASYVAWIYGRNVSYLLLVMVIIGIVWCVACRRLRGFVLTQAIVLVLFVDANSYGIVQQLPLLSFHWTLPDRLTPLHYWIILPLAAIGVDVAGRGASRLLAPRAVLLKPTIVSAAILLGLVLPLGTTTGRLSAYSAVRNVVAPPDLNALDWLAHHASAQTVVLNDGDTAHPDVLDGAIDAGLWMPAISDAQPVFFRATTGVGALPDGVGALPSRLYTLEHIADTPLPRTAARFIALNHVQYVYYGARTSPMVTRHLILARLLKSPYLHLLYSSAVTCQGRALHALCPVSASYIFAVHLGGGGPRLEHRNVTAVRQVARKA